MIFVMLKFYEMAFNVFLEPFCLFLTAREHTLRKNFIFFFFSFLSFSIINFHISSIFPLWKISQKNALDIEHCIIKVAVLIFLGSFWHINQQCLIIGEILLRFMFYTRFESLNVFSLVKIPYRNI